MVVAAVSKAGFKTGAAIAKNLDLNRVIKDSPHSDPKEDRPPSPDQNFVIQSPLEYGEVDPSPLEVIFSGILSINICRCAEFYY